MGFVRMGLLQLGKDMLGKVGFYWFGGLIFSDMQVDEMADLQSAAICREDGLESNSYSSS